MPSQNGTLASPSSPSRPRKSLAQRYHREPRTHLHRRLLSRRLPRPVAAGEPAPPLRRRHRLEWGAHYARAQPAHLPPHRAASVPPVRGDRLTAAHQALLDAGFPAGSEPTWAYSYRAFWDPFQRILREEIDPTYDGDTLAGYPFCAPGTVDCDADYDLASRPAEVKEALEGISLTGRIGKPLLQLQGTLDTAVTPRDSRLYATMIANHGRGAMTRLYEVEGGSHFEDMYGQHPGLLRPMLPCFRDAFERSGAVDPGRHAATGQSHRPARRVQRPGQHLQHLEVRLPG